jgi:predicted TIM-barrel fold metal-dependent hydrolase
MTTESAVATLARPSTDSLKKYFVVSADCHVSEPADLWEKRIESKFRHRIPRIEVDEDGEKWSVVEGHRPVRVREIKMEGEDLERAKAGSRDPLERIRDGARDGIDAEVVYPNKGLQHWTSPDAELQTAVCRVWNDWALPEVFKGYEDRMAPAACIAPLDVATAIQEVQRVAAMGYRHLFLPVQPQGNASVERRIGYNHPMFDPLWATIQDAGLPISLHVGTGKDPRTSTGNGGAVINYVWNALATAIEPVVQFSAAGIMERFPNLKVVTVEAGIGWLAWTLWAADEGYNKHHFAVRPKLQMLPSEYWKRQGYSTFGDDPMGIDNLKYTGGSEHVLWGNDYPHHEGTWPHSAEAVERTMGHLPEAEKRNILGLNAAKLYGFTVPEGYGA